MDLTKIWRSYLESVTKPFNMKILLHCPNVHRGLMHSRHFILKHRIAYGGIFDIFVADLVS